MLANKFIAEIIAVAVPTSFAGNIRATNIQKRYIIPDSTI
jgi:hypothetical protein